MIIEHKLSIVQRPSVEGFDTVERFQSTELFIIRLIESHISILFSLASCSDILYIWRPISLYDLYFQVFELWYSIYSELKRLFQRMESTRI